MNAYFVDAGVINVCIEDMGELGGVYGNERICDVVFAKTRSQAQYQLWQRHLACEGDLHEFNYRTRLLVRDVDPARVDVDALWMMAGKREPLLDKWMREGNYWTDPTFWAERIELELGEMIALYEGKGLTYATLRSAVHALSRRYAEEDGDENTGGRWS